MKHFIKILFFILVPYFAFSQSLGKNAGKTRLAPTTQLRKGTKPNQILMTRQSDTSLVYSDLDTILQNNIRNTDTYNTFSIVNDSVRIQKWKLDTATNVFVTSNLNDVYLDNLVNKPSVDSRVVLDVVNDSLKVEVWDIINNTLLSTYYIDNVGNHAETVTTLTNTIPNGNLIGTYTNEAGAVVNIKETLTSYNDQTTSTPHLIGKYLDEFGNLTDINETLTSLNSTLSTGHLIGQYVNEDNVGVTIKESIIGVVNNADGSTTITKEDGTTVTTTPFHNTNFSKINDSLWTHINLDGTIDTIIVPVKTVDTDIKLLFSVVNDSIRIDSFDNKLGVIVGTPQFIDDVINKPQNIYKKCDGADLLNGEKVHQVQNLTVGSGYGVAKLDDTDCFINNDQLYLAGPKSYIFNKSLGNEAGIFTMSGGFNNQDYQNYGFSWATNSILSGWHNLIGGTNHSALYASRSILNGNAISGNYYNSVVNGNQINCTNATNSIIQGYLYNCNTALNSYINGYSPNLATATIQQCMIAMQNGTLSGNISTSSILADNEQLTNISTCGIYGSSSTFSNVLNSNIYSSTTTGTDVAYSVLLGQLNNYTSVNTIVDLGINSQISNVQYSISMGDGNEIANGYNKITLGNGNKNLGSSKTSIIGGLSSIIPLTSQNAHIIGAHNYTQELQQNNEPTVFLPNIVIGKGSSIIAPPAASTDPGIEGEIRIDATYIYWYKGGQWLRIVGTTF